MRILKSYQFFLEEAEIAITTSDRPDEKAAKETHNKISKELDVFTENIKPEIDKLYSATNNDKEIKVGLDKITKKYGINAFMSEYATVSRLKREILDLQNKILGINKEKTLTKDPSAQKTVSDSTVELKKKQADLLKREQEMKIKMDQIKRDLLNSVKKIQDIRRK